MANDKKVKRRPQLLPENVLTYAVSKAIDLAIRQIEDGTASSQVISHFLKLGSPETKLKVEILEEEKKLIKAKTAALEAEAKNKNSLNVVLKALSLYSGNPDLIIDDVDYEEVDDEF